MHEMKDFARRVLAVLDQQQAYFKSRQKADFTKALRMEKALREEAQAIVAMTEHQPTMF